MLRIKGLPSIYVDDKCKAEYYSALSKIDKILCHVFTSTLNPGFLLMRIRLCKSKK